MISIMTNGLNVRNVDSFRFNTRRYNEKYENSRIRDDLLMWSRCTSMSCYEDILHLRELAGDRSKKKELFSDL